MQLYGVIFIFEKDFLYTSAIFGLVVYCSLHRE